MKYLRWLKDFVAGALQIGALLTLVGTIVRLLFEGSAFNVAGVQYLIGGLTAYLVGYNLGNCLVLPERIMTVGFYMICVSFAVWLTDQDSSWFFCLPLGGIAIMLAGRFRLAWQKAQSKL